MHDVIVIAGNHSEYGWMDGYVSFFYFIYVFLVVVHEMQAMKSHASVTIRRSSKRIIRVSVLMIYMIMFVSSQCLLRRSLVSSFLVQTNPLQNVGRDYCSNRNGLFKSMLPSTNQSQWRRCHHRQFMYDKDTIFALSTPPLSHAGASAVAVIRISGPASADVLRKLMENTNGSFPKARYAALRKLSVPNFEESTSANTLQQGQNIEFLDDALVLYFPNKNSFTGEETVEIQCHGSRGVVTGILDTLGTSFPSEYRLRPADRGEFTQRAFESGNLNLLQIEALADLIVSETSSQRRQALRELSRENSSYIVYEEWRKTLTQGLAHAEAIIDFGDDDEDISDESEVDVWSGVRAKIQALRESMEQQLTDRRRGEITREGMRIAILGPPNAGKSTLLNYLARRDVAIVSSIAGTTRDVVSVSLDLNGIKCVVSDTAGLRAETDDLIEIEGMRRARKEALRAHIRVCVVDAVDVSSGVQAVNRMLYLNTRDDDDSEENIDFNFSDGNTLFVANKVDLLDDKMINNMKSELLSQLDIVHENNSESSSLETFSISCSEGTGIDSFLEALTSKVTSRLSGNGLSNDNIESDEGAIITRARHRQHITAAVEALRKFEILSTEGFMSMDLAAEELRLATSELGRVVGAVDVEDVLDVLFADFCIGK